MNKKIIGIRIRALIETLLLLIAVTAVDIFFGNSDRFTYLNPHPFLFISVVMAAYYGTFEGIAAVIFSTFFLYAGNIPEQTINQTLFEYQYHLALQPLLWFLLVFIVGESHNRFVHQRDVLNEKLDKLHIQSETIVHNYEDLKASKENLEAHLVSQQHSSTATYKTLKGLETLNPAQVILQLHNVVSAALKLKKFSVYAFGPNGLEVATSQGWNENEPYLLRIMPDHMLYQEMLNNRRVICLINKDDEVVLDGQGVMAGPLLDAETGVTFGMIKVEEIDYMELNISNLETFKTVCELAGMAYTNAREHKHAESQSLFLLEPTIFSYPFFTLQSRYQHTLARINHYPLSLAKVAVSATDISLVNKKMGDFFNAHLPEQAQCFGAEKEKGHFLLLLPFTTAAQAESIALSLAQAMMNDPEYAQYRLKTTVEVIYEPAKEIRHDRSASH